MRVMHGLIYRDYTVVVNPTGAPEGRFRDAFSIHRHKEGQTADLRVTVYQRSISEAQEYDTQEEAIEAAMKFAGTWIDSQYR